MCIYGFSYWYIFHCSIYTYYFTSINGILVLLFYFPPSKFTYTKHLNSLFGFIRITGGCLAIWKIPNHHTVACANFQYPPVNAMNQNQLKLSPHVVYGFFPYIFSFHYFLVIPFLAVGALNRLGAKYARSVSQDTFEGW